MNRNIILIKFVCRVFLLDSSFCWFILGIEIACRIIYIILLFIPLNSPKRRLNIVQRTESTFQIFVQCFLKTFRYQLIDVEAITRFLFRRNTHRKKKFYIRWCVIFKKKMEIPNATKYCFCFLVIHKINSIYQQNNFISIYTL